MNSLALDGFFHRYTSSHVPYDYATKFVDTNQKRKKRKEIARQLTKMNMEKKEEMI